MKQCFKCLQSKPLTEFYKHSQMADGYLNKCKDCAKKDVRQARLEDPEKVREYDRSRARLPHRVNARRQYSARYEAENPDRKVANTAVNNAVRQGRLKKQPCAFCSSDHEVEAHHHDYAKPLDITWLCRPCHRRFHALERMATYRKNEAA